MKFSSLAVTAAFMTMLAVPAQARGHRGRHQLSSYPQATEITQCGATISQPGNYSISGNLDCAVNGPVLTIAADNVHLSISGELSNPLDDRMLGEEGGGIEGSGSNLTIDGGGSLFGYYGGLQLTGDSITIADLTIGMAGLLGGETLTINGSNATVQNCYIYGAPMGVGVGDNAVIKNNVLSGPVDSPATKAILHAGANAIVANNTFKPDPYDPGSQGGTIFVAGANSRITGNKNFGMIDVPDDNNTISRNTGLQLIWLEQGAVNNTVSDNSAVEGRDDNGPPCVNTWENNRFQSTSGAVSCIQ